MSIRILDHRFSSTFVILTLVAAVWLLTPITSSAQGTMSLQLEVPEKTATGQLPISRVKLIVSLASDTPVAFTITPPVGIAERIPGTGTLSPGSPTSSTAEFCGATCAAAPGTVANDEAWIEPPAGGLPVGDPQRRRYVIWLSLLSDFDPNSPSFCGSTMSASTETWTIAIDSGPAMTGACPINFDPNCPGAECSLASVNNPCLVDVTEPVATVVGFPASAQVCAEERPAVDVMLALDKSGSMNSSTQGGTPSSKIQALQNAVTDFVNIWESLRTAEGSGAPSGDQIGLTFFDSNAHWMDDVGISGWSSVADGLNSFDSVKNTIRTHIGSLNAGGSTSMGDALVDASNELFAGGNGSNGNRKVILVMSNGKENSNLRVKVDNTSNPTDVQTYLTGDPSNTTALPNQSQLQIYSVTVGTGTAVSADVNEDIAKATGGYYVNSEDNADLLGPFFLELLQNFTKFNTYETARLVSGELSLNQPFATTFHTSGTTRNLAVSLRLDRRFGAVRLTLQPPGGGQPISQIGSGSIVMAPTLPLPPPKGEWSLEISSEDPAGLSQAPFQLVVLADDTAIKTDLGAEWSDYEPGDSIVLRARLTHAGQPIAGLDPTAGDKLQVRLVKPGTGVGDMLSESSASTDQPAPGDPMSDADAMLHNELQSNPDALTRVEDSINLRDDGGAASGDEAAGDGIYSGVYPATLPGHYNFLFAIEGTADEAGPFTRQHLQTVHVRSVPDPDETEIQTQVIPGSGEAPSRLILTITPKTTLGNLLGPSFGPFLWVIPDGGDVSSAVPTVDNLDGTYTATVFFSGQEAPATNVHFVRTSANLDAEVPPENLTPPLDEGSPLVVVPPPDGPAKMRRFSLSLHGGVNEPRGTLGNTCSGDLSYGLDLEYLFGSRFAIELFYGHEDFDCASIGGKPSIDHLSVNGKAYFLPGTWRLFVLAGFGRYDLDPGPSENGWSVGGGVQANFWSRIALEATLKYHTVDTAGNGVEFATYHLGARFRF